MFKNDSHKKKIGLWISTVILKHLGGHMPVFNNLQNIWVSDLFKYDHECFDDVFMGLWHFMANRT